MSGKTEKIKISKIVSRKEILALLGRESNSINIGTRKENLRRKKTNSL